jgi:hypothetical protein
MFKYFDDCLYSIDWYTCQTVDDCTIEQIKEVQGRLWVNTYCAGLTVGRVINDIARNVFSQIPEKEQAFLSDNQFLLITNSVITLFFLYKFVDWMKIICCCGLFEDHPPRSCCGRIGKMVKNTFCSISKAFCLTSASCALSCAVVMAPTPFAGTITVCIGLFARNLHLQTKEIKSRIGLFNNNVTISLKLASKTNYVRAAGDLTSSPIVTR